MCDVQTRHTLSFPFALLLVTPSAPAGRVKSQTGTFWHSADVWAAFPHWKHSGSVSNCLSVFKNVSVTISSRSKHIFTHLCKSLMLILSWGMRDEECWFRLWKMISPLHDRLWLFIIYVSTFAQKSCHICQRVRMWSRECAKEWITVSEWHFVILCQLWDVQKYIFLKLTCQRMSEWLVA